MTQATDVKFNFKTRTIKDDEGKVIRTMKKQPSITVALPYLTAEEIVGALQSDDAKVKELILDYCNSAVKDQARAQFDELLESFGEDDTRVLESTMLDFDKLTLSYIANLPPAQRGARALTDEEVEAFYKDYLTVMPEITGKPLKNIQNHLEFFKKPARIRNSKAHLEIMLSQLDIYIANSAALEDTGEAANRIRTRFDKWLKAETAVLDLTAL